MEIIAAFLILAGANAAGVATDKFNASPKRIKREVVQMERAEERAFNRMLDVGERLSREGR